MMSYEICKFSLNDEKFLNYKPSQIAACAVILSINIFKKEEIDYNNENGTSGARSDFLQKAKENPKKYYLNTQIWSNAEVEKASGYKMAQLAEPLYDLSQFMEQTLEPNRLEDFHLEQITSIQENIKN